MFDTVFMQILDMTIIAVPVILIVIVARFLLKGAPKVISYGLWFVVLFRLLCPLVIEAPVSIVPQMPSVSEPYHIQGETYSAAEADRTLNLADGGDWGSKSEEQSLKSLGQMESWDGAADGVFAQKLWLVTGKYVWIAGMIVMAGYALGSWRRLRRKLAGAVVLRDNIYLSDYIDAPFVLGIFCPKIYLPSALPAHEQGYILLHEQHHIRRLDHIVKILAFTALCLHWFNPLVWISFVLFAKDMEMSCDEAVIKKAGEGIRADYSALLLRFASDHTRFVGMPLAFGEGDAKGRIKNLANWKKPVLGAVIAAAVVSAMLAVGLLTDPLTSSGASGPEPENLSADRGSIRLEDNGASSIDAAVSAAVLAQEEPELPDGLIRVESHVILASSSSGSADEGEIDTVTEYALVLYEEYSPYADPDQEPERVAGSYIPTVLTFSVSEEGVYTLTEYWIPRDGSYYAEDIREKFPASAAEDALNAQDYVERLSAECWEKAKDWIREHDLPDVEIAALLDTICASPAEASNPGAYIEAHPKEYARLAAYGEFVLRYCMNRFLQGDETGLKGHVMMSVCEAIAEEWGEELLMDDAAPATGQDWFEAVRKNAEELAGQYEDQELEKYYPVSHILLKMMDESDEGRQTF